MRGDERRESDLGGSSDLCPPIGIPRTWIERRIEQTKPDLSLAAIERLDADRDTRLAEQTNQLGCEIEISYNTHTLRKAATLADLAESQVLELIESDFENGVAIEERADWLDIDGNPKTRVSGADWEVVLYERIDKASGIAIAFLDSAKQMQYPNQSIRFQPTSVRFKLFGKEQPRRPCSPKRLEEAYNTCVRSYEAALAADRRLTKSQNSRTRLVRKVEQELGSGRIETHTGTRGRLAAELGRQFSPLRLILHLLRMRSGHDRQAFSATVIHPPVDDHIIGTDGDVSDQSRSPDGNNLWIEVLGSVVTMVDPGARIELRKVRGEWVGPLKVLDGHGDGDRAKLEIQHPGRRFRPGEQLDGVRVPRFRLWAHQKAINRLRKGEVGGSWPDLVRTLCMPKDLDDLQSVAMPKHFFCDSDSERPSLNERQREAVAGALATKDVFCIQGPPGTGKTAVICELVQQLIGRGERVLLASTTHEAVNEVLQRIGSAKGVRAIRVTINETKATGVEQHLSSRIIEPFVSAVRQRTQFVGNPHEELEVLEGAIQLLEQQVDRERDATLARAESLDADSEKSRTESVLETDGEALKLSMHALQREVSTAEREIEDRSGERDGIESRLRVKEDGASLWGRVPANFGIGEIAVLRRLHVKSAQRVDELAKKRRGLWARWHREASTLASLEKSLSDAVNCARRASIDRDLTESKGAASRKACQSNPILRAEGAGQSANDKKAELEGRATRLTKFQALRCRFEELLDEGMANEADVRSLTRDVLSITNLIGCTTTGIAGSPELKDLEVDTLIIDEASRLTDSEFLIGAVRAKRWILVGDEQQLPPFVEQSDEHFIHALLALRHADQSGTRISSAVEELADWWHEDEEHHRFRIESVTDVASELEVSGDWTTIYRDVLRTKMPRIESTGENATRLLLRAIQTKFVHSLFERVVETCPPSKRVRLVEQRRMIAPIAEIVRGPIYGGDYETPSEVSTGILPFVTPTFRKPITFLDTSTQGERAREKKKGNGFINELEAAWVVAACRSIDSDLADLNVDPVTVSILAFYQAQATLIEERLETVVFSRLQVQNCSPIDRMQGKEADIVILSFCRATQRRQVSPKFGTWLQDTRRLNVACTRARRALIFVGQKKLLMRLNGEDRATKFFENLNHLFSTCPETMQEIVDFRR